MEQYDDVKRAVRAALRAIQATNDQQPSEKPCQHMAAAIQQLAFAVEKLVNLIEQSKPARTLTH